jgi:hypothetical protein
MKNLSTDFVVIFILKFEIQSTYLDKYPLTNPHTAQLRHSYPELRHRADQNKT